jgi:hypothetical protein
MISKKEFRAIIDNIVSQNYPEEMKYYQFSIDDHIDHLYKEENIENYSSAEFKIDISATDIVHFTFIAIGTYITIRDLVKSNQVVDIDELKEIWIKDLVKAKLKLPDANNIVEKHINDLKLYLKANLKLSTKRKKTNNSK